MSFSEWPRECQLAYIAGIIDGEGSIGIRKGQYGIQVQVGQSLKGQALIELLSTQFGAKVVSARFLKNHPNRQPMVGAIWHREQALPFLRLIHKFLILKKKQATIAIEFQAAIEKSKSVPWTAARLAWAREQYNLMRFLNRRGLKSMAAIEPVRDDPFAWFSAQEKQA